MALTITVAGSGVAPAAVLEQAGPDGTASDRNAAGDAFAGVLAGLGQDAPAGRSPVPARGPTDSGPADPADDATDPNLGTTAADLAALVLAVSGTPVPTTVPAGTGLPATDESSEPTAVAAAMGPAPQAALAAQQAAARRPAQALEAPVAAAAKASRPAASATGPATEPTPVTGPGPLATAMSDATPAPGTPTPGTPMPTGAAATPSGAGTPMPTGAAGTPSGAATPSSGTGPDAPAGMPPAPAGTPANSVDPGPATPPGTGATPAVVTLPDTAALIASTSGAARAAGSMTPDPANPATSGNAAVVSTPGATHRGGAPAGPRAGHPRPDAHDPAPAAAVQAAPTTAAPAAAGHAPDPAPAGIAALQQPAPSAPTGPPAAADAQPVPRHPVAEPLASQVAGPVLALRARGDGSHQLMIALHPAELGPVNLHVRISGDAMTISLASSNDIARDTLREALPQLRAELQSAGLGSASLSLDLTSGGSAGSGAFAEQRHATGDRAGAALPDPISVPVRPRVSGRLGPSTSPGLDRWL